MHNKFQLVDPYAIARRIKQLRNSEEAAENNNKMTIEDEVERSDEAECQRNSQSTRSGRMKRLKVCTDSSVVKKTPIVKQQHLDNPIEELTINVLKACTPFFSDLD